MDASPKTDSSPSFDMIAGPLASRAARSDFYYLPDRGIEKIIARVEKKLLEASKTDIAFIDVMGKHMLFSQAKRLRPLFVMLGQLLFGDELLDKAVDMAAAVELIHCASLFHDDVIDGAQYRKGNRAANAIWGNRSAVIMGDHFFVLAYTLIAGMRDHYLLDLLVKTCRTLAEGVILEIKHTGDISISEDIFMDTITRKTATFSRTPRGSGAISRARGRMSRISFLGWG